MQLFGAFLLALLVRASMGKIEHISDDVQVLSVDITNIGGVPVSYGTPILGSSSATVDPSKTLSPEELASIDYDEPAQVRASLLGSGIKCPAGLCQAGFGILDGIPRPGGSNRIPETLLDGDFTASDSQSYFTGLLAVGVIIPLIFCFVTIIGGCIFCCARSSCNACGERVATQKYTRKQVIIFRVLYGLWVVFMFIMCALSIIANHSTSTSLSHTVDSADTAFTHILNVRSSLLSVSDPFTERLVRVRLVQDELAAMPTQAEVQNTHGPTVVTGWPVLQRQSDLVVSLGATVQESLALQGLQPVSAAAEQVHPPMTTLATGPDADAVKAAAATFTSSIASLTGSTSLPPSLTALYTAGAAAAQQAQEASLALHDVSSATTSLNAGIATLEQLRTLSAVAPAAKAALQRFDDKDASQCSSDREALATFISAFSVPAEGLAAAVATFAAPLERLHSYYRFASLNAAAAVANLEEFRSQHTSFAADSTIDMLKHINDTVTGMPTTVTAVGALSTLRQALIALSATSDGTISTQALHNLFVALLDALQDRTATAGSSLSSAWNTLAADLSALSTDGLDALLTVIDLVVRSHEQLAKLPVPTRFLAESAAVLHAQVAHPTAAAAARDSLRVQLTTAAAALDVTALQELDVALQQLAAAYAAEGLSQLGAVAALLEKFSSKVLALQLARTAAAADDAVLAQLTARAAQIADVAALTPASLVHTDNNNGAVATVAALYDTYRDIFASLPAMLSRIGATCSFAAMTEADANMVTQHILVTTDQSPATAFLAAFAQLHAPDTPAHIDLAAVATAVAHLVPALPSRIPTDFAARTAASSPATSTESVFRQDFEMARQHASDLRLGNVLGNVVDNLASVKDICDTTASNAMAVTAGSTAVLSGRVLPSHTSHRMPPYVTDALITTSHTEALTDDDRDTLIAYLAALSTMKADVPSDIGDIVISMEANIGDLDEAVSRMFSFSTDYYSLRHDVKREGYLLDEQRLLIVDVVVIVLTGFVFFSLLAMLVSRHKCLMMMVMLVLPVCALLFVMAAVHLTPGMAFADICRDTDANILHFLGKQEVDVSFLNGVVSFLGEQISAPMRTDELYLYFARCQGEQPDIVKILNAVDASSPGLTRHDMADFRGNVTTVLSANGLEIANGLNTTFALLGSTSGALADKAHEIGALMQCQQTSPLIQVTLDDNFCDSLSAAMAIAGCILFLHALCILPGLCLGCAGFKKLNVRNSSDYKRTIRHDAEGVLFIDGGIAGHTEVVKLKHREMALKDTYSLEQLKGFSAGVHVTFAYNNDEVRAQTAEPQRSPATYGGSQRRVYVAQPSPRSQSGFGFSGSVVSYHGQTTPRSQPGTPRMQPTTPRMQPTPPGQTTPRGSAFFDAGGRTTPRGSVSRSTTPSGTRGGLPRGSTVFNTPTHMSTPATRAGAIEMNRIR